MSSLKVLWYCVQAGTSILQAQANLDVAIQLATTNKTNYAAYSTTAVIIQLSVEIALKSILLLTNPGSYRKNCNTHDIIETARLCQDTDLKDELMNLTQKIEIMGDISYYKEARKGIPPLSIRARYAQNVTKEPFIKGNLTCETVPYLAFQYEDMEKAVRFTIIYIV